MGGISKWTVDAVHSTVGFEVKHMMVSKVKGQFKLYPAEVEADDLMDLTTAKINREDFGLTWNTALETGGVLVGKDGKIKVELEVNPAV